MVNNIIFNCHSSYHNILLFTPLHPRESIQATNGIMSLGVGTSLFYCGQTLKTIPSSLINITYFNAYCN